MKKIRLGIVMLCLSFSLFSQEDGIRFGVKGGVNFSNVLPDSTNSKFRTSIHFGGFVEIPIANKFAIQPELLYSSQGLKTDGPDFR